MQIPADRAFWILDYYRAHSTVLAFGGRILGEDAACEASVSYVWPEVQSIGIKLLSEDRKKSWDRIISFERATFSLVQLGDPEFARFGSTPCHSVLIVRFPDETIMFLAEKSSTASVPETRPAGSV